MVVMMFNKRVLVVLAIVIPYCISEELDVNATNSNNATCSFETDCCGWWPCEEVGLNSHWRRQVSENCSNGTCTGHGFDLYGGRGSYMYVSNHAVHSNQTKLQLQTHISSNGPHCFSFSYMVAEGTNGSLRVVLEINNRTKSIWSTFGHYDNLWRDGRLTINETVAYRIGFEAMDLNGTLSTIAVDDTDLKEGPCYYSDEDKNVNCTFNKTSCGWTPVSVMGDQWRTKTDCGNDCKIPGLDKIKEEGGYMYVSSPVKPTGVQQKLELTTGILTSNGTQCFSFFYHMYGIHVGSLSVYVWGHTTGRRQIWTRSASQDNVWREGRRTIDTTEEFQIIFQAVNPNKNFATIAISKTQLTEGPCLPTAKGSCDFEDGFCGWTPDDKWTIKKSDVLSKYGGPKADHSSQTTDELGNVALLLPNRFLGSLASPIFNTTKTSTSTYNYTQPICVEFWYFIPAGGLSTLSVFKQDSSSDSTRIQRLSSGHGVRNQWTYAEVSVNNPSAPFQFLIEGNVRPEYDEVIAIDDVQIEAINCQEPGKCSFDHGFCDWEQVIEPVNDTRWLRTIGGSNNIFDELPTEDSVVTDTTYFLFVSVKYSSAGDVATIRKYVLDVKYVEACFTMYYTFNEKSGNLGHLNVTFRNFYDEKIIFDTDQSTGASWSRVSRSVVGQVPYQIFIKAKAGSATEGFIAINYVSLIPGLCKHETNTTPTSSKTTDAAGDNATTKKWTGSEEHTTLHGVVSTVSTSTVSTTPKNVPDVTTFQCGDVNNTRVLHLYRCDNFTDCPNRADEQNCAFYCTDDKYFCNENNCIDKGDVCKGKQQCIGRSDDADEFCKTDGKCPASFCGHRCECHLHGRPGDFNFSCKVGYEGWRCKPSENSTISPTGTESTTTPKTPVDTRFDCQDGNNTRVSHFSMCDGIADCPNGKDEECSSVCTAHHFLSEFSPRISCITGDYICSGNNKWWGDEEFESFCKTPCPHEILCGNRCTACHWKFNDTEAESQYLVGQIDSNGFDCKPGFAGWRCKPVTATQPTQRTPAQDDIESHLVWIAIPMMSFFVVVILILAVMLYRRRYSWIRTSDLIGPNRTLYSRNSMSDTEEVNSVESSQYHHAFTSSHSTTLTDDRNDDYLTATDA